MTGSAPPAATARLRWVADPDPRWDDDRARVLATVPAAVFETASRQVGEPLTGDWWAATDGDQVVGYGWLDDVWGDAEILLAVESGARGAGVGAFVLAHLEGEASARGLNYVVNVVRDTHPQREQVTAWLVARGVAGTDDGRLRKRAAGTADPGHADGHPTGRAPVPDDGLRARYAAERDRAAARPRSDVVEPDTPSLGPGAEESGGYVDPEQHRY